MRAPPDRQILIRVELKQFLAFINLGINYRQPLNAFKDDEERHQWETTYKPPDSMRSLKRQPLRKKLGRKQPPPPSPPEPPPPPSPPLSSPPPATEAKTGEQEEMDDAIESPPADGAKEGGTLPRIRKLQFFSPEEEGNDSDDSSVFFG